MRHPAVVLLAVFLFSSCAASVVRVGYKQVSAHQQPYVYSEKVTIVRSAHLEGTSARKVGSIKIGGGTALTFTEFAAMGILEQEAMDLGADLVTITKETVSGTSPTGYSAQADFIVFDDKRELHKFSSDDMYSITRVKAREKRRAEAAQANALKTGVTAGLAGAMISTLFWPNL